MEEILGAPNLLVPFEVTLYGEEASDLGGPRKEFLTHIMQDIIQAEWRLFELNEESENTLNDDSSGLERKYNFGTGLVCGLSLLQNGLLQCFLTEEEFETLMSQNLTPVQAQFRDGLNQPGFVYLMRRKPCIQYLFCKVSSDRKIDQYPKAGILRYRIIHKIKGGCYISEIHSISLKSGRRRTEKAKVTLKKILQFKTPSAEIPVLEKEHVTQD
ncbi:hypothetical protein ACJMK2_024773 [Sinanodonta woodiana]|uniref:HECT domain-containing protein n=1 Tax=Sinanodonta woodiana TaxID=1069815 RepID=A0ABD3XI36_SINWO